MSATRSSSRTLRSILKHDYASLNRVGEVETTIPHTASRTQKKAQKKPSSKKGGVKSAKTAKTAKKSISGKKSISAARMKVLHQCA